MKWKKVLNLSLLVLLVFWVHTSQASYVSPTFGGGQSYGEMLHVSISYDSSAKSLVVSLPEAGEWEEPTLRPLTSPDAFDPGEIYYSALNGKAYNIQYGWSAAGYFTFPAGSAIWIERIHQSSSDLKVYEGGTWSPILGADGAKWKWSGVMTHNTYAVPPSTSDYEASYRVYFADATTGSRDLYQNYGADEVTLKWHTIPEPATLLILLSGLAGIFRKM